MHASDSLYDHLVKNLPSVHLSRIKSVFMAVDSLLKGGQLSLTALGRSAITNTTPKHNIKRIDRLLGNDKLYDEIESFCEVMARLVIKPHTSPTILVDWTQLGTTHCALVASVSYCGRSFVIYFDVKPLNMLSNREVETTFLKVLRRVLPIGVIPTIVTDSGYRNPWFKEVDRLGWYFVGRLAPPVMIYDDDGQKHYIKDLERGAKDGPKDWGECVITKRNPLIYRVIQAKPFKRNSTRSPQKRPIKYAGRAANRVRVRCMQSWVLGTNHKDLTPDHILEIYAGRMHIEELFRDLKNHRFGWSLRTARTKSACRYAIMILIAFLSYFIVMMVGISMEKTKDHLKYQSNSITSRRVLSLFFLGKEVLRLGSFDFSNLKIPPIIKIIKSDIYLVSKTGDT